MLTEADNNFAIEANNLTKRYGSTLATNGLNLSVCRGTTFGLLGPNGGGKSSFILMLMGLSDIDEGSAKWYWSNFGRLLAVHVLPTSLLSKKFTVLTMTMDLK